MASSTNYSVLAADDQPVGQSVNNVQVVVAEPADLIVIHRKRQRRGAGGCCCVAICAFFLLFFLIPRTPSVTYKGTVLPDLQIDQNETYLQSEFRLDNNDYYSVEWSEADFNIAYKSTMPNVCQAAGAAYAPCWIVVATAHENNEKWNTGALASKVIQLNSQFEISGVVRQCAYNSANGGYVFLRSSGTIKARTSTTTQKVNVKMQSYAVQCYY